VRYLVQTGLNVHPEIPRPQKGRDNEEGHEGLEQLEDANTPDKDDPWIVPVHAAADWGHLGCIKIFIEEAKVDVDVQDEFARTPLIAANNHPEAVRYLLAHGADPTARNDGSDHAREIMGMFASANVLEYAAGYGNVEVMKLILDHPSFSSTREWLTPFSIKCAAGGGLEPLKLLLERGGYPMTDKGGATKAKLLSKEQKQNIIDATPLAAHVGDLGSLKLLLSYQFPSDDNEELLPFEVPDDWHKSFIRGQYNAMEKNQPEKFEFLQSFGLKEHESMSLDKLPEGQNINIQHLLHTAVEAGSIDCVKHIIEKYGANPHRHYMGVQPLYTAATSDKTEMVRYLLENHKVDTHFGNGRYATGPTALWGAINLKSLESIALLLQHGGPVDHIDEELRNIEGLSTAILRAAFPGPGRPEVFLETEEHAREYVESKRHIWENLNPPYVRLELGLEDKEWLKALQLRKGDEELRETGIDARVLNKQEGADSKDLGEDDVRKLMVPLPTYLARETELRNDDDLLPEFEPHMVAPGY
jgi:ankyrin repeat protein